MLTPLPPYATEMQPLLMGVLVAVVCIVAPAVLSLIFSEILRKLGWIKKNDLKLEL